MNAPQLIVMAAGIGSRYGGIKQIEPIGPNQEIILDYSIYDALRAGFDRVIFVISKEIELEFRKKIEPSITQTCEVVFVTQKLENIPLNIDLHPARLKPWGTAHAVLSCKKFIDSPFAVINADDFYGRNAYELLYKFLSQESSERMETQYCMIGYTLENTLTKHGPVARGICDVDKEGWLRSVHERTRIKRFGDLLKYNENGKEWVTIPAKSIVSMNMWGFTTHIFSELQDQFIFFLKDNEGNLQDAEFFLPEVVNNLLFENKVNVKVLPTNDKWYGITYKPDKTRIKKAILKYIRQGLYPDYLWEIPDGT
jgi:hypothetical protein